MVQYAWLRIWSIYVKRSVRPFMSPKDILAQIDPEAEWFAILDAKSGYWQVELDQESRKYTTFLTE